MEGSPQDPQVTVDPAVQAGTQVDPQVDPNVAPPASQPAPPADQSAQANQPQEPTPAGATADPPPAAVDPETLHPTAVSPQQNPQEGELPVKPAVLATPSEAVADAPAPPTPIAGRVDNLTSRTAGDALQGGFVEIDIEHDSVPQNVRDYSGDPRYGVFLEPVTVGDNGYPELCLVKLRDSNAHIVVGYESLSPADAGRR